MSAFPRIAGIALGLCLASAVLALVERGASRSGSVASGPILSECDGAIEELVIQYVPESAAIVEAIYRRFVGRLPPDVTVHVVCPDREAFDDLAARLGPVRCRLLPVLAGHAMSCWARDRWVALGAEGRKGPAVIWLPRGEDGADVWPQRAGDQRVGEDIAGASRGRVVAQRSRLYFDGGDFLADGRMVFVTPAVAERNLMRTVRNREELLLELSRVLKRPVKLLADAPDHHAAMYMAAAGEGTMIVGDPGLAAEILREAGPSAQARVAELLAGAGGCDFSAATQRQSDSVAAACAEAGYRVVRIPLAPGCDGRIYLTYVNVIMDQRDGSRVVYMPVYRGAEALNQAAAAVWRSLGYSVQPIDCTAAYTRFGSLHCLVNVLRRSPQASPRAKPTSLLRGKAAAWAARSRRAGLCGQGLAGTAFLASIDRGKGRCYNPTCPP